MEQKPINLRGLAPLLLVFDVPASLHFYCDILGFEVVSGAGEYPDDSWVLLNLHKTEIMLEPHYPKNERPEQPVQARVSAHADTFIYFGCSNIDQAYEYLLSKGLQLEQPRIAPYGMKQLYLQDPDGYRLCFQWPATEEMMEEWRKRYGKSVSA